MLLEIAPELLEMGLSVAALTVRGVDNSRTSPELIAYRRQQGQRLATYWKNRSITAHPAVCEYHRIHDLVGAHGQAPAPEKLITYVRRQRDLTTTGAIIDCYNLVSAKTLLSIGAHDIARLASPITLRYATAEDSFVPLGQTEEKRFPGEYAYIDPQNRIVCRLDVLQCEYSKVTSGSRDIVFFLQGNRCLPATTLLKGAWLLAEMIETFCGGHAELVAFYDAGLAEPSTVGKPTISFESFKQLNLQVGTVLKVERYSDFTALSGVTVQLESPVEALVLSSLISESLVGRRVVVATGLFPLALPGKTFAAYILAVHKVSGSVVLEVDAAIPDGQKLY